MTFINLSFVAHSLEAQIDKSCGTISKAGMDATTIAGNLLKKQFVTVSIRRSELFTAPVLRCPPAEMVP